MTRRHRRWAALTVAAAAAAAACAITSLGVPATASAPTAQAAEALHHAYVVANASHRVSQPIAVVASVNAHPRMAHKHPHGHHAVRKHADKHHHAAHKQRHHRVHRRHPADKHKHRRRHHAVHRQQHHRAHHRHAERHHHAAHHRHAERKARIAHAARAAVTHDDRMIDAMVAAGDRIATLPYVWGGGHGYYVGTGADTELESGYDCSGSVSFVLHAAGLLSEPEDSSELESYGDPGPGRRVTVYANADHAFMVIDERRFDTVSLQETGDRWSDEMTSTYGYVAVHPPGL